MKSHDKKRKLDSSFPEAAQSGFSRRGFLQAGGLAGAALSILPASVLGRAGEAAPNSRPAIAGVGIGGVGHGQIQACRDAGFEVVALCDVDDVYAQKTFEIFPQARRYRDYREMFEAEGDRIDAVYCGTPDHTHALISLAALNLGKHTLTVKPLTRTIHEARILGQAAEAAGVMTQMTASSAVTESGCRTCELIWDGAVGGINEVHIWSDRPLWPQGMARPMGSDSVPDSLDWQLWLGPAPQRPFVAKWPEGALPMAQVGWGSAPPAVYHPWNFRGWQDFGTGALGDMGCHHFNTPRRALKLGHPIAISASSTKVLDETWPLASIVTWEFPERDGMPPVKVVWYDGGLKPPRPAELEAGRELPGMGILYVGEDGLMLGEGTSSIPEILPASKAARYTPPPKSLPRRGNNYVEWMEAIRGGEKPSEHWPDCATPLTEIVLLGNIAIRRGGRRLEYDGPNMRIVNDAEADRMLHPEYHNGWTFPG